MPYDEKFNRQVIVYKDSEHTFAEFRETSTADSQQYYAWKRQSGETAKPGTRYPQTREGKIALEKLLALLAEHPGRYWARFAEVFGVRRQPVQKRFAKRGITRKKTFYLRRKAGSRKREVLEVSENNTGKRPGICGVNTASTGFNGGIRAGA